MAHPLVLRHLVWRGRPSLARCWQRRFLSQDSEDTNQKEVVEQKKPITPFYKRLWRGTTKAEEEAMQEEARTEKVFLEFTQEEKLFVDEERREEIRRKRNKSGLRHSDRLRLHSKPPLEGLQLESEDLHARQDYKAAMFGLYGRASGVSPSACWPTRAKIEEDREWENVFYDGEPDFKQRLKGERGKLEAKEEHIRKR